MSNNKSKFDDKDIFEHPKYMGLISTTTSEDLKQFYGIDNKPKPKPKSKPTTKETKPK